MIPSLKISMKNKCEFFYSFLIAKWQQIERWTKKLEINGHGLVFPSLSVGKVGGS